ncbi:helix-turn-helix domain-containing protein [Christensenellaceae bacterium OttesenSCG-928-L17]|nr:helix-turn-helix domain-containing protein [Christensenellaceae bacterium OttesenSCG-928-L17]
MEPRQRPSDYVLIIEYKNHAAGLFCAAVFFCTQTDLTLKGGIAMNTSALSQRDAYKLMLRDYPDVMNIHQMSELLGVSTKTGYRLLQGGEIACMKVGRSYRIPKVHVLTYLKIGSHSNL